MPSGLILGRVCFEVHHRGLEIERVLVAYTRTISVICDRASVNAMLSCCAGGRSSITVGDVRRALVIAL